MGYTTPDTVTGSSVLTAALWNSQVRDNFEDVAKPHSVKAVSAYQVPISQGGSVPWTAADEWDTTSMHSTSANTDRIVFPVAGIYAVNFVVSLGGPTAQAGSSVVTTHMKVTATLYSSAGVSKGNFATFYQAGLLAGVTQTYGIATAKVAASDYMKLFVEWQSAYSAYSFYLNYGAAWGGFSTANTTNDFCAVTMLSRTV